MGNISADGMVAFEAKVSARQKALNELTSQDFNLNDPKQMAALKNYIDSFEYWINQMYLFQGVKSGFTSGLGGFIAGFFLPLPNFANYFMEMSMYCGLIGMVLEHFSINEFHTRFKEMQTIYDWSIKNKLPEYDGRTDNSDKLAYPDIQRLIKLLAPLSSTQSMLAWPKITGDHAPQGRITYAVSAAFNFFSAPVQSTVDIDRIKKLKTDVETREFDVGTLTGFENSIHYFFTNTNFRALALEQIKHPVAYVKQTVSDFIFNSVTAR